MNLTHELFKLFGEGDIFAIENYIKEHPNILGNKDLLGRAVRHGNFDVVKKVYTLGATNVQNAIGHIIYGADREVADFLVERGANTLDVDDPVPIGACEVLNAYALQLALELAEDPLPLDIGEQCVAMLLSTYSRNISEKKACFNVLEENGIPIPDTLMMNIHRSEVEQVSQMIDETPEIIQQLFKESEIYPPALGIKAGDGLHLTPLNNSSLLHIALEFHDWQMAEMLLHAGIDPNIKSAVNADGFGGYTPLFQTIISYPPHSKQGAQLLMEYGADPSKQASIWKQLKHMSNSELEKPMVFHNVTPQEYAHQFPIGAWVNWEALGTMKSS